MAKRKDKLSSFHSKDATKYYRATYLNIDGTKDIEVFISDTLDHAILYATGPNAYGRTLSDIFEYDEFIDSLL